MKSVCTKVMKKTSAPGTSAASSVQRSINRLGNATITNCTIAFTTRIILTIDQSIDVTRTSQSIAASVLLIDVYLPFTPIVQRQLGRRLTKPSDRILAKLDVAVHGGYLSPGSSSALRTASAHISICSSRSWCSSRVVSPWISVL